MPALLPIILTASQTVLARIPVCNFDVERTAAILRSGSA